MQRLCSMGLEEAQCVSGTSGLSKASRMVTRNAGYLTLIVCLELSQLRNPSRRLLRTTTCTFSTTFVSASSYGAASTLISCSSNGLQSRFALGGSATRHLHFLSFLLNKSFFILFGARHHSVYADVTESVVWLCRNVTDFFKTAV